MTVAELIEKLRELPPTAEVSYLEVHGDIDGGSIYLGDGPELTDVRSLIRS